MMARGYIYRRPVRRSHYSNYRRNRLIFFIVAAAVGAVVYFIYSGLKQPNQSATSSVTHSVINGGMKSFYNNYFQFQDTGTWVINKKGTNANRIIYRKYYKNTVQAEMIVYINQTPIPLNLATPRVLPVRIVNDNSFQPTVVSAPCVSQYAQGALHAVKQVTINNSIMLCDPDNSQFYVVFSEIGGNYDLNLRLSNGKPIQFVITYKDAGTGGQLNSIINIASSFKTR